MIVYNSTASNHTTLSVFKDMNSANISKVTKKGSVSMKTEASGDKENLVERGHLTEPLKAKTFNENEDSVKEKLQKISELYNDKKIFEVVRSEEKNQTAGNDMKSNHHLAKEKIKKITEIICDEKKKAAEELFEKNKITSEDLTTEEQGEYFWKLVAEKRREALKEALSENEALHKKVEFLETKIEMLEKALAESTEVIDLLNEIVADNGDCEESSLTDQSSHAGGNTEKSEIQTENNKEVHSAFGDDTFLSGDSEDD